MDIPYNCDSKLYHGFGFTTLGSTSRDEVERGYPGRETKKKHGIIYNTPQISQNMYVIFVLTNDTSILKLSYRCIKYLSILMRRLFKHYTYGTSYKALLRKSISRQ